MSFTRFSAIIFSAFVAIFFSPAPSAQAIDGASDQAAREILETTWDKKQQSRQQADAIIGQLFRSGTADSDAIYAYLLAKIRQSDVRNAVLAAEKLLELDPTHLRGHHAKCWLLLLTREQSSALSALKKFDEVNDADKTIDDETRIANVRAIGRMFGYLQGPMAVEVSEANLRIVQKSILDGANEDQTKAFEEQRDDVIRTYQEIIGVKQETEATAIKEGKEEQEKTLTELKEKTEKLEEREQVLEPVRDKISAEGEEAIARIRSRAVPLESELERLNQDAFSLQQDLAGLVNDAVYYESLALKEQDPALRDGYLRQADRLRISARSVDFALSRVYGQGRSVTASLDLLHRELLATQAKYGAKLDSVQREMTAIEKEQQRAKGQANRASRPVRGTGSRTKALENKASGITTYEEFPVELERDRLLAKLKARAGR